MHHGPSPQDRTGPAAFRLGGARVPQGGKPAPAPRLDGARRGRPAYGNNGNNNGAGHGGCSDDENGGRRAVSGFLPSGGSGNKKKPINVLTNPVSILMALIFALPSLGAFLGVHYVTGNLAVAAASGFGIHFVVLAFSGRISERLDGIMN